MKEPKLTSCVPTNVVQLYRITKSTAGVMARIFATSTTARRCPGTRDTSATATWVGGVSTSSVGSATMAPRYSGRPLRCVAAAPARMRSADVEVSKS